MSSDIPLWVAAVIGLGPSLVAIVAIVDANLRDRRRIEQEREARLRDERIEAYRKMLTASTTAHADREGVNALYEAYSEISLLAESDEIDRAAATVWVRYGQTLKAYQQGQGVAKGSNVPADTVKDFVQALGSAEAARDQFLTLAREELGIKDRTAGFRDLEGSTPDAELPDPETPSSER